MPGKSFKGQLPALTEQQFIIKTQLRQDLSFLCQTIGERNILKRDSLKRTADYIAAEFKKCKDEVDFTTVGPKIFTGRQDYQWEREKYQNIILEIRGDTLPDEIIVVGAHYDTVAACPGADDNGSGTVGVMALARILARQHHSRTLRFVAFPNEEFCFRSHGMGSYQLAQDCRNRSEKIIAMLSLEMIGSFSSASGSQNYPPPLNMIYPNKGDFIAFVGESSNRPLITRFVEIFRARSQFPCEGLAAPAFIPGIDWSDHLYFAQLGYTALMVTDTAFYRNDRYHRAEDNLESIDLDKMTRVVGGLAQCLEILSRR